MNTVEEKLKDVLTAYGYEIFDTELHGDKTFRGYRIKKNGNKYLVSYSHLFNLLSFERMENGMLVTDSHCWDLKKKFNKILMLESKV